MRRDAAGLAAPKLARQTRQACLSPREAAHWQVSASCKRVT